MSKIAKAKKAGEKIIDEIGDMEMIQKALRAMKGESDDAVSKLGSGKNLEALQQAKVNAPNMEAPAYPKNVQQDALADIPASRSKDFVMADESLLPVPTAKKVIPEVVDEPKGPMLPALRKNTLPENIIDAEVGGKSNKLRNIMAGAGLGTAGLAGFSMMDETETPKSEAMPLLPIMAAAGTTAAVNNLMNPAPKQPELPRMPAVEKPVAPIEAPVVEQAAEDDYMKMMKEAQDKQNEHDFIDNMLRAGITGGAALAGNKADYSGVEALQKQNTKGVENVKSLMTADMDAKKLKVAQGDLEDDTKLRDPNSDISKTLRGMLSKLGYPVTEKVSGKQLKDMGINVYNLIASKEAREAAKTTREDSMNNSNRERTKTSVDKGLQNLRTGKEYKAFLNTKDAIEAFDYALASGDKEAVGTAFMKFAKSAQGDDSVVRSEDMKTLAGTIGIAPDKLINHYMARAQGKGFSRAEMENMKKVMQAALKVKGQRVYQQSKPLLNKIDGAGLDLAEHIDPAEVEEFSTYGGEQSSKTYSPAEQKAIEVVMKNNGVSEAEAVAALKEAGKIK